MSERNQHGEGDRVREAVSALIDGESDDLELRRLLASEDADGVRIAWRDYHLQRDALNGVDMSFAHIDISQRIQAALADEQPLVASAGGSRWWRPLASMAVAASVATVVVVGARSFNPVVDGGGSVAQATGTRSYNAPVSIVPAANPALGNVAVSARYSDLMPTAQPAALDPDQLAQQRLQQYLLRHTERASLNNGQGVISFAKVSQLNAQQQ